MKRKLIIRLVLFVSLLGACVNAYGLSFTHSAIVENSGGHKYKAIRISAEIYNNTRPDLADLMLYDKNHETVPYFINSYTENNRRLQKTYAMKLVDSFRKNDAYTFDFSLASVLDRDVTATSIECNVDKTDFAKKVEIWGSYDNVNWEKIQDDMLYDVGGSRKLEIEFSDVRKYTNYRLKLSNNLEKVAITQVLLKYNKTLLDRKYFIKTVSPKYSVEQKTNTTVIKLHGVNHLKIINIAINTEDMFKRNVVFYGTSSKMLYNLTFKKMSCKDLTMQMNPYTVGTGSSEIVIYNEDDKPIDVKGVEVKYLSDDLVFDGSKDGDYTLQFGNNAQDTPKIYDIKNYSSQIIDEGYDILKIKKIITNKVMANKNTQTDYKPVFNITILIAAAVMAFVLIKKLKR